MRNHQGFVEYGCLDVDQRAQHGRWKISHCVVGAGGVVVGGADAAGDVGYSDATWSDCCL